MKLNAVAVVASVALVSASPLRVVVVSNSIQRIEPAPNGPNVRFGLATAGVAPKWDGQEIPIPVATIMQGQGPRHRGPCTVIRQKAIDISNSFLKAFGFAPIGAGDFQGKKHIHDISFPMVAHTPNTIVIGGIPTRVEPPARGAWFWKTKGGERVNILTANHSPNEPHSRPHPGDDKPHRRPPPCHDGRPRDGPPRGPPPHDGPAHYHGFHHVHHEAPFFHRVESAILSLGPWEGRAVAFVLGCGLGVLLRMFWVLAVVLVRSVRGGGHEEDGYVPVALIVHEGGEATPLSAPPAYIYPVDEKTAESPSVKTQPQAEN